MKQDQLLIHIAKFHGRIVHTSTRIDWILPVWRICIVSLMSDLDTLSMHTTLRVNSIRRKNGILIVHYVCADPSLGHIIDQVIAQTNSIISNHKPSLIRVK